MSDFPSLGIESLSDALQAAPNDANISRDHHRGAENDQVFHISSFVMKASIVRKIRFPSLAVYFAKIAHHGQETFIQ